MTLLRLAFAHYKEAKTMKFVILVLLAVLAVSGVPSPARCDAVVDTDISVAEGLKTYIYNITNAYPLGDPISAFSICMPEAGARSIISFGYSGGPGWQSWISFNGDLSSLDFAGGGNSLQSGETMQIWLKTPDSVPTSENYRPLSGTTNFVWSTAHDVRFADYSIPVPVPEPSSLAALGLAISGAGAALMRRKRT